jgi:hypothetical protein
VGFADLFSLWLLDVLSAALDAGTAVGLILVYFWSATLFPRWLSFLLTLVLTQSAISIEWKYWEILCTAVVCSHFLFVSRREVG